MGLFGSGGLKSAASSVAQIIASLVGQNISANSYTATSTSAAGLTFTDGNASQRVQWGNGQFIGMNVASSRIILSAGATAPNYALGAGAPGTLLMSATAPTIVAGAGASVVSANGTACFEINLGGAASTGTITLPTAATGWVVYMQNVTHPDANVLGQTGFSTTTATFTNYVRTTGVAGNWSANDHMVCIAMAY